MDWLLGMLAATSWFCSTVPACSGQKSAEASIQDFLTAVRDGWLPAPESAGQAAVGQLTNMSWMGRNAVKRYVKHVCTHLVPCPPSVLRLRFLCLRIWSLLSLAFRLVLLRIPTWTALPSRCAASSFLRVMRTWWKPWTRPQPRKHHRMRMEPPRTTRTRAVSRRFVTKATREFWTTPPRPLKDLGCLALPITTFNPEVALSSRCCNALEPRIDTDGVLLSDACR